MSKSKSERKHDSIVSKLEHEIGMDYARHWKFLEYCRNGLVGEVDLLCLYAEINGKILNYCDDFSINDRRIVTIYDFYEIKSNPTRKAIKKAKEQYKRFTMAFPEENTRGFMYSSDNLLRML